VLVFFGPIWTGLCCFMSALASHEQDLAVSIASLSPRPFPGALARMPALSGLGKVAAVSVVGQVAAMCSSLMAALFCVVLLMVLEQQLLAQTLMDEVLVLCIWLSWVAVSIRVLVRDKAQGCVDDREMKLLSSLQVAVAVCGLWLASRACVNHVVRREAGVAYSTACLWLLAMVALHDLLMAAVHLLFRLRLRSTFLCSSLSTPPPDVSGGSSNGSEDRHGADRPEWQDAASSRGLAAAAAAAPSTLSLSSRYTDAGANRDAAPHSTSQQHSASPGAVAQLPSHTCSVFSRDSCDAVTGQAAVPHDRRPLAQRRHIGDVYYGALSLSPLSLPEAEACAGGRGEASIGRVNCGGEGRTVPSLLLEALFAPGTLAKVQASVSEIFGTENGRAQRGAAAETWCDPPLCSAQDCGPHLPYMLVTCAASGYVRTAAPARLGVGRGGAAVAREGSGARQELSWPFLLSPGWCGSDRTGFFPTPGSLRLSDALALSSGNDFFASCRGWLLSLVSAFIYVFFLGVGCLVSRRLP